MTELTELTEMTKLTELIVSTENLKKYAFITIVAKTVTDLPGEKNWGDGRWRDAARRDQVSHLPWNR